MASYGNRHQCLDMLCRQQNAVCSLKILCVQMPAAFRTPSHAWKMAIWNAVVWCRVPSKIITSFRRSTSGRLKIWRWAAGGADLSEIVPEQFSRCGIQRGESISITRYRLPSGQRVASVACLPHGCHTVCTTVGVITLSISTRHCRGTYT